MAQPQRRAVDQGEKGKTKIDQLNDNPHAASFFTWLSPPLYDVGVFLLFAFGEGSAPAVCCLEADIAHPFPCGRVQYLEIMIIVELKYCCNSY